MLSTVAASAQNVVVNGDFNANINGWYCYNDPSSAAWSTGAMRITVPSGNYTQGWVQPVRVVPGSQYVLSGTLLPNGFTMATANARVAYVDCGSDAPCITISGSCASLGSSASSQGINWQASASASTQSLRVTPAVSYGVVFLTVNAGASATSPQSASFDNISLAPVPTATFTGMPGSIIAGQSSTLSWTTTNASSVTIDNGVGSQPLNGSISVSPAITTTYTLTATGPAGTVTKQVTITVSPPPTATFSASPTSIALGASSTLSWTATNATSVSIDNGLGSEPLSGSTSVTPATTTTYTLTATGSGGTVTKQATVTVNQPPTIAFSANPTSINTGQSATLTWTTTNATSVTIDNGIGAQALSGSFLVNPSSTTTYTLTASGASGTRTATATVTVSTPGIPQVTFSASPSVIAAGGTATLTWSTSNATSVSIDNGIGVKPLNGSAQVNPAQTTTYKLTATGSGGSRTATTTVTIAAPPTIVFTATPPAVLPGGSVQLAWQVLDATLVTIDPDLGAQPFAGSITVTPKGTTTYVLTAAGIGGTRVASVTVVIGGKRRAAKH